MEDILLGKSAVCYMVKAVVDKRWVGEQGYDDKRQCLKRRCWKWIDAIVWKDGSFRSKVKTKYSVCEAYQCQSS